MSLKKYIGTKIIEAEPVVRLDGEFIQPAAKKGAKITRRGWNGKGMWVIYRTGYPDGIPCNKNTAEAVGIPEGSLFKVRRYLQMKCVDGSFQMWLASQSDILADDWEIIE